MNITAGFARSILNEKEPQPGIPSKGELFFSFLICKNLNDFCETGQAILAEMKSSRISLEGLPKHETLGLIRSVLKDFYSESMFIPDSELDLIPNWTVINKFNKDNTKAAYQLYRIIRRNIKSAEALSSALENRNKKYFLENIDSVFADVPFKDLIKEFKNFIGSTSVTEENAELIWGYFQSLVAMIQDEAENIKLIESL